MELLLLVLLVAVIIALLVWNLPRLRAQAAARRSHRRIGPDAPGHEPMGPARHVPDDDELSMRAQAHREAAQLHARQAAEIEHGAVPAPPPAAPPSAAPPPAAPPPERY